MRSDRERLRDIVEHADLIASHLPASREELEKDVVLAAALIRWVGIVGEAAARLSDSFQNSHPSVPWPKIVGMRNHLVHGYFVVDVDLLWVAVTVQIPDLAQTVLSWLDDYSGFIDRVAW